MVKITHSKSYNINKTNNTTSKNKTMYKRQRTSNSTIKESRNSSNPSGESFDDARNDLLDDPTLDEFIMDINTPHNSTSFNNESLEESDKSPIKKSNSNVTKRLLHYKPNINLRDGLLHLLHVVHKNLYLIMNQICINKFYTIGVKSKKECVKSY
ncbi:hypothetical protein RirG_270630 [Rhizophagus irregularis DAOM 197198w]|uniref:Uncharacterized protein n=1 Tax=Rhizophagus irregularis (strain DAOM 197198w) TaxID=1432141 RepID=A0A015J6B2_RHIIW|nr:hypothetical protein RirG_270630 [Rhizophagus irregularis DAOM 197198w]